jgi:pyrroline-5-carboxylate reductase
MPSLPVSVNQGIILVLRKDGEDFNFDYFESLGKIIYLKSTSDYEKMTSICCCAPGYIYHIFEHYQLASEQMQIESEVDFKEIVYQIFKGTLLHYEQNRNTPFAELKSKVASKKGTTEAGFEKMANLSVISLFQHKPVFTDADRRPSILSYKDLQTEHTKSLRKRKKLNLTTPSISRDYLPVLFLLVNFWCG